MEGKKPNREGPESEEERNGQTRKKLKEISSK
jgi:hypothetical protein